MSGYFIHFSLIIIVKFRGGGVEYNFNVGNMVLILEDFKGIKTGQSFWGFSFRAISTIFLNL